MSGLICQVLNSSRDRRLGTEYETRSRQFYELITAAPSVEAHHRVNSTNTLRNSGGRRIMKKFLFQN